MSRDNVIIISGFPGVGKSHLKNALPEGMVADSDSSLFNKEHFPSNYIKHIKFLIEETNVKFILVSSHEEVREALMEAGLNFVLVTPTSDQKEAYLDRYTKRGSPLSFINLMEDKWDEFLGSCVAEQQVTLLPNSYLLDTYTEIYRRRQPIYRDQFLKDTLASKVTKIQGFNCAEKEEFTRWASDIDSNEELVIVNEAGDHTPLSLAQVECLGDVLVYKENKDMVVCKATDAMEVSFEYGFRHTLFCTWYPIIKKSVDPFTEIYRKEVRDCFLSDQDPLNITWNFSETVKTLDDHEAANEVEFSTWVESLKKNERLYIHNHSNEKIYLEKGVFFISGDVYALVQNRKFLVCDAPNKEISHYAYLLFDSSSGEAYPLLSDEVVEEPRLFQHINANTKENDSFITVVGNEFKAWLEDLNEGEAVHVRIGGIDQETTSDRFEVNDSLWGVVDVDGFYIGVPKEPMEHSYYLFDPDSPQAFPIFKKKVSEDKAPKIDGFENADLVEFANWVNELEENECINIVDSSGEFHVIGKDSFTLNGRFWCINGFPNFYICVPDEPMECLYYVCDVITGQKLPLLKKCN